MRSRLNRIDVIVIVVVLGLMLAVAIPFLDRSREDERRSLCEFRMGNVARAILKFEEAHNRFPGYREATNPGGEEPSVSSWVELVSPLLEGADSGVSTPQQMQPNAGIPAPTNRSASREKYLPALVCPDDSTATGRGDAATLSYVANCGMPDGIASAIAPADWPANGVFLDRVHGFVPDGDPPQTSLSYVEAHDGSEETLLLSENVDAGNWTNSNEAQLGFVWVASLADDQATPNATLLPINVQTGLGDASIRFARPSSFHPGGVNAGYCDGHVAFLSQAIDPLVFAQLMTSDGTAIKYPGTATPIGPPYRESAATLEP